MKAHILTLFPEMVREGLSYSITGRAMSQGLLELDVVNIRDYAEDAYGHVDDYPYGGGAGMVMKPGPVYDAYRSLDLPAERRVPVIYASPQGEVFSQRLAEEWAKEDEIVFLCGHYEGIDERVLERIVTKEVSLGDYVLTGGELPVMVMIDAVSRLIPGVLNNEDSARDESFSDGLLEYPQYTRPEVWEGEKVPDVLLSGHHQKVDEWRHEQSLLRTAEKRPDLLEKRTFSPAEEEFLKKHLREEPRMW